MSAHVPGHSRDLTPPDYAAETAGEPRAEPVYVVPVPVRGVFYGSVVETTIPVEMTYGTVRIIKDWWDRQTVRPVEVS